jgi:hypothetical protein
VGVDWLKGSGTEEVHHGGLAHEFVHHFVVIVVHVDYLLGRH